MSRWIRVQTSIFDHEIFVGKEFSERDAWIWLIGRAAWKETRHRVGKTMVAVPIGSLFTTLRELQDAWKWGSDYRVRSFLKLLQSQRMISLDANAGKTLVTICNYSRYQNGEPPVNAPETQDTRTENAQGTQGKRTKDTSNTNTPQSFSLRSKDERLREFEIFWEIYPNKVGRRKALLAFETARKRADLEPILAGLRCYAGKTDDRPWCNPATWLHGDRWEDDPATPPPRQPRKSASQERHERIQAMGRKLRDDFTGATIDHEPVDYEEVRRKYRAEELDRADRSWK